MNQDSTSGAQRLLTVPGLTLTAHRLAADSTVLVCAGIVDAGSAAALQTAAAALAASSACLVIDLRPATVVTHQGLNALAAIRHRLEAHDCLALITDSTATLVLLRITGLDRLLPVFADHDEAAAGTSCELRAARCAPGRPDYRQDDHGRAPRLSRAITSYQAAIHGEPPTRRRLLADTGPGTRRSR